SSPSAESAASSAAPVASSTGRPAPTPAEPPSADSMVECWRKKVISGTTKAGNLVTEWEALPGLHNVRTLAQNAKLHALRAECGIPEDEWRERLMGRFNKKTSADLSIGEAKVVIDQLETRVKK